MSSCKYCGDASLREKIMLPIRKLDGGALYLMKDQTLAGRCIFASDAHVKGLQDLTACESEKFTKSAGVITRALKSVFRPQQVNCLILGDLTDHLHMHIVPKYIDGPDWGSVFVIDREDPVMLEAGEYQSRIALINKALDEELEKAGTKEAERE